MKTTRPYSTGTTDTLKGFAISAVLINHYLNLNNSGDYSGFAFSLISIFFIVSGYGLYYSLARRFSDNFSFRKLFTYYYDRFIRIFPMLWIAWLVEFIVRNGNLSFWNLSGITGTGHYWFIPLLLQCYIISPLIFLGTKKNISVMIGALIVIFGSINWLAGGEKIPALLVYWLLFTCSAWNGFLFLHILTFAFGFVIPHIFPAKQLNSSMYKSARKTIVFWGLIVGIVLFMVFLKQIGLLSPVFRTDLKVVFFLMIGFLCTYAIHYQIANSLFAFLGRISYSIYLFHMSFYLLISRLGGFEIDSIKEFLFTLFFFPVFIYFCIYLEKLGKNIRQYHLWAMRTPKKSAPSPAQVSRR